MRLQIADFRLQIADWSPSPQRWSWQLMPASIRNQSENNLAVNLRSICNLNSEICNFSVSE